MADLPWNRDDDDDDDWSQIKMRINIGPHYIGVDTFRVVHPVLIDASLL